MGNTGSGRRSGPEQVAESPMPAKATLRRQLLARRKALDPARKAADDARRLAGLATWLDGLAPLRTVAAYVSWPSEPDTTGVLDLLRENDVRVIVPLLRRDSDGAWSPDWVLASSASSRDAPPNCAGLGVAALADADVVLVPGLAGTPDGDRLGRGGGWYDRALAWARPDAPVCLLLYTGEGLPRLPVEPHDRRVNAIATPGGVATTCAMRS